MKIHEYQSRRLLADAGVPVPPADVVESVADAVAAHQKIGGRVVVKAQVFAGGRGKAGFVKLCDTPDQTRQAAEFMLTNKMVSKQTGPAGVPVSRLLVAAAVDIAQEYYVGMVVDRARRCPVMMVSREGGVEIEEVAARHPEAIIKEWLHPHLGLQPYQVRKLTQALGFTRKEHVQAAAKVFLGLADVFLRYDASLAEINPLMITAEGDVLALDAKMNFDDNALFRHRDIVEMRDLDEENPLEVEASKYNLNYIKLDGEIGCMVNGAGLAMATMDIIKLSGSEPANFLDVGGGASQETVENAFRILVSDPNVKAVMVNIFGGIVRTDRIANGMLAALRSLGGVGMPVVVRLEGTNSEQGRAILRESEFDFIVVETMAEAAQKVVAAVKGGA